MSPVAVFIRHRTLPGQRPRVVEVWMRHMAPAVARNPGHLAYFYCEDAADPDSICAFQQYASQDEAKRFLETPSYAAYLAEVEPLLSGPPQITPLGIVWSKPVC